MAQGVVTSVGLRPRLERLTIVGPAVTRSRACLVVCLVLPSAAFYALVLRMVVRGVERGSNFASFWAGAGRVLHGVSPYPAVGSLPAVADRLTFVPYVYPPPAAFALGPLSPLPFWLADTIFFCLIMAAVALALRVLDVTDWRCYAAGFACVPVMAAVAVGSLSTLLLLGVALAWRWRHTTWRLAAVVAALVVAKLFLWPLWLWLVYTRRLKAAALSAAVGAAATFGAWAVIGFAGLGDYPTLLSRLSELVGKQSYSLYALFRTEGISRSTAQALVFVVAALAVAGLARRVPTRRTAPAACRPRASRPDEPHRPRRFLRRTRARAAHDADPLAALPRAAPRPDRALAPHVLGLVAVPAPLLARRGRLELRGSDQDRARPRARRGAVRARAEDGRVSSSPIPVPRPGVLALPPLARRARLVAESEALPIVVIAIWTTLLLVTMPFLVGQDTFLAFVDGRLVAQHGLPHADTLTYWSLGRPWTDQQWGAHLALYELARLGGAGTG